MTGTEFKRRSPERKLKQKRLLQLKKLQTVPKMIRQMAEMKILSYLLFLIKTLMVQTLSMMTKTPVIKTLEQQIQLILRKRMRLMKSQRKISKP